MNDTVVVTPTYNERSNIDHLLGAILKNDNVDVLVVDDNSSDGTFDRVVEWSLKDERVHFIRREGKLGLGTAYVTGFKWGLKKGYKYFFEMDADMSHDPSDIPRFLEKIQEGFDVVIGSRYMKGTISVVGWDFKRLLLSKFGNWYATTILNLKEFTDITSGYRVYTRRCLELIGLDGIKSNGYSFQIEMVYNALRAGCRVCEIPIVFYEREHGSSKMSKKIALEAAYMVWRMKFDKFNR